MGLTLWEGRAPSRPQKREATVYVHHLNMIFVPLSTSGSGPSIIGMFAPLFHMKNPLPTGTAAKLRF